MTTSTHLQSPQPAWQEEKHLKSGERIWILTDIYVFDSYYYEFSERQIRFRVGILDLNTKKIGFATFGNDIGYAIVKSGVRPPPWKQPLPEGILLHRETHGSPEEKGRYRGTVERVVIDPELVPVAVEAKKMFRSLSFQTNSTLGMWDALCARADRENAIECAAMSQGGWFSAGDIKKIVGKDVDVTSVLQRLVEEGKLQPPKGKKKGTRYRVATKPILERADWTD